MKTIVIAFCIAVLAGAGAQQTESTAWRGITPFHSTRTDVERLLGRASGNCNCQYDISGDHVRIDYSGNRCGKEKSEHWDLPPDTVLTITLHPQKQCPLTNFNLDTKVFQKTDDPELKGYAIYTSDSEGVEYYATNEGKVFMIIYFGSMKDRTALRCK